MLGMTPGRTGSGCSLCREIKDTHRTHIYHEKFIIHRDALVYNNGKSFFYYLLLQGQSDNVRRRGEIDRTSIKKLCSLLTIDDTLNTNISDHVGSEHFHM